MIAVATGVVAGLGPATTTDGLLAVLLALSVWGIREVLRG